MIAALTFAALLAEVAPLAAATPPLPLRVAPGNCGNTLFPQGAYQWHFNGGVPVYSNGRFEGTGSDCGNKNGVNINGQWTGEEWQCVEFVNRLWLTKGWMKTQWKGDAGDSFFNQAPSSSPGGTPIIKQRDGSITYLGPGDVVDIDETLPDGSSSGHVFVVNTSAPVTSGTVELVSQNSGSSMWATPDKAGMFSGGRVVVSGGGNGYVYRTVGVIHAPAALTPSPQSASGFLSDVLVAAGLGSLAPSPLAITTSSLPNAVTGQPYSAQLSATGGTPPYTWQITVEALPAGLSLDPSTGVIAGTPSAAAVSHFTVQVKDSTIGSAQRQLSLTVTGGSLAPIDLGTLGGAWSEATAVSGSIIVGESFTASTCTDAYGGTDPCVHAFAYDLSASNPHMIDLGTLGGSESNATAVSGSIVVGASSAADGSHAFAYDLSASNPHMIDLGTLGGAESGAVAVDGNIVVGSSWTGSKTEDAFAYDLSAPDPHMIDLGHLVDSGQVSQATAVSGSVIVGYSESQYVCQPSGPCMHAFAYDLKAANPRMIDLGTLDGDDQSSAVAVSQGIIVGFSQNDEGCSSNSNSVCSRPFTYDLNAPHPHIIDLGTLGGRYSSATAVSGAKIVGCSDTAGDSESHPFSYDLASPNPLMTDAGSYNGYWCWWDGFSSPPVSGSVHVSGSVIVASEIWPGSSYWRSFVYDLAAVNPSMIELAPLTTDCSSFGDPNCASYAAAISGSVVVGYSGIHAVAWALNSRPL